MRCQRCLSTVQVDDGSTHGLCNYCHAENMRLLRAQERARVIREAARKAEAARTARRLDREGVIG